jgi:hypothetical protein
MLFDSYHCFAPQDFVFKIAPVSIFLVCLGNTHGAQGDSPELLKMPDSWPIVLRRGIRRRSEQNGCSMSWPSVLRQAPSPPYEVIRGTRLEPGSRFAVESGRLVSCQSLYERLLITGLPPLFRFLQQSTHLFIRYLVKFLIPFANAEEQARSHVCHDLVRFTSQVVNR